MFTFNVLLRKSLITYRKEKLDYVKKVINSLKMKKYINTIIKELEKNLNIKQRKRLIIEIKLVTKL